MVNDKPAYTWCPHYGKTAAKELMAQGSDPEFFRLDEEGKDLEDEL